MRRLPLFIILAIIICANGAVARISFVALNGNNHNPGSEARPWRTLAFATSGASGVMAGDTIFVREGNYPETVTPQVSGTAFLPIIIRNYKTETVTLRPGKMRFESGINYWKVRGLSLQYSDGSGFAISGTHALNFLTIQNCTMSHHKENGIYLTSSFGGVTILDCDIQFNGEWRGAAQNEEGHGIVIYGGGPGKLTVKRCLVANNWHKGIAYGSENEYNGNGTEIDSNVILNNYESGCDFAPDSSFFMYNYVSRNGLRDTEAGEWGDKGFMTMPYCSHTIVAFNVIRSSGGNEIAPLGKEDYYYNNTLCKDVYYTAVSGSPYQAIMTFYARATPNSVFRNNIFVNLLSQPQHHFAVIAENYSNYTNQIWSNNLYWCPNAGDPSSTRKPFKLYNAQGRGGIYKSLTEVQATWPGLEKNSVNMAPDFVSYPDSNFTLLPGSPAIDAGTYVGFPYTGQAPDMGRFESQQAGKPDGSKGKPSLLNYLQESGAVLALNCIGADNLQIRIDPAKDELTITPGIADH
jgi:hypothetical protein